MFLKLKKSQQEGKYSQGLLKNYLLHINFLSEEDQRTESTNAGLIES